MWNPSAHPAANVAPVAKARPEATVVPVVKVATVASAVVHVLPAKTENSA